MWHKADESLIPLNLIFFRTRSSDKDSGTKVIDWTVIAGNARRGVRKIKRRKNSQ